MESGKLETTYCNGGQNGGPCLKPRQRINHVIETRKNKIPRLPITVGKEKFKGLLDSGAGRSLIKTEIFNRLKEGVMNFTTDVPVELYGVENTRLVTRGLATLQVQVLGDNLLQDFIVVDSISEKCILGVDALYEHKFVIDGSERRIFRVKQPLKLDSAPTIITRERITIKPFATVVESEGNGAQLPPNLAFYFHRGPGLNSGLRIDPFLNQSSKVAAFTIALVNETNKPISLPRYEILGTLGICRVEKEVISTCTEDVRSSSAENFDNNLPVEMSDVDRINITNFL